VLVVMTVSVGCGSSSTTTVGPSPVKCDVSLGSPNTLGPGVGTGTITVSTERECSWSASTSAPWVMRLTPTSGQGSGQIQVDVAANAAPSTREGEVVVNDVRVQVRQAAAACEFEVSPDSATLPAAGGPRTFTVTTIGGCAWTASSAASWAAITSAATGSGSGRVDVQVDTNGDAARSGTLTIGGQSIPLSQSAGGAAACTYTLQPAFFSSPAGGTQSSASVASPAGCAWTATTNVPWVTISSGAAGNGNGSIGFTVAANGSSPRSGQLTVEGQTLTISQPAQACDFAIQPASAPAAAAGGSLTVSVTVATGCDWTAVSEATWLTVTSGASGSGVGSVSIAVAPHVSPARTGTVRIAGSVFTVSQANGCTYALNPAAFAAAAGGAAGATDVAAGPGCPWTIDDPAPWIAITSGAAGTGNGRVTFTAGANSGPARTGTFRVQGQTFTVNQENGCAYSVSPSSVSIGAAGGSDGATVSTEAGCTWSVQSDVPWITGSQGSGSGPVTFSVAPNVGPARQGTLSIGSATLTVHQASGCAVTGVTPPSNQFGIAGGQGTITFTLSSGACTWSATAVYQGPAPFITILGTSSGTGPGTVVYSVFPQVGQQRTGEVRISTDVSSATHTVRQN
jgi:hypothetical protein